MVAEFHYPQKDKYKQVKFDLSEDSVTSNHGVVTESGLEEDIQGEDSKPVHRVFDQRTPNLSSGRRNNFLPTISFDTVPIQGVSPDDDDYDDYLDLHTCSKSHENNYRLDYTLEEYYNNEDINYNCDYHNNWCYANSEGQRTVSPMRSQSPSFRNTAGIMGKYDVLPDGRRVRIDYPSKPTLLSDSFVINRTHRSWRSLWKSRKDQIELRIQKATLWYRYPEILFPKAEVDLSDLPVVSDEGIAYSSNQRAQMKRVAKVIRTPVGFPVSPRTLLCHISGRKHTWVALDWVVLNFMRNTDHIVVVASLPRSTSRYGCRSISGSRSRSRSRSIRRSSSMNPNSSFTSNGADSMVKDKNEEWSEGYSVGKIEGVLNNLIEYINFIIPTDLAIKVTVEFMIGKTKQVLIESLNLHSPDLIIASTLQYKENDGLVDQKSKRLTSVLAKFYPFPVFIVPAKRMAGFESKMEAEVNSRHRDEAQTSDKHREVGYTEPDSTSFRPRLSAMRTSPSVLIHENASSNEVFGKLDTSDLVSVDSERSDSVLDRIDRTSTVTSSYDRVAKLRENYREKVQEDFSSIEMDNTLPISQKHFAKLDAVVSASIDFNTELERSDSPSILELQRIITGGEKHKGFRKKSMLDVFDMPTNKPKRGRQPGAAKSQDGDPTPRKSTIIKFGANVKGADGSSVLQQGTADEPLQDISPLRQVKSLSQSNLRTSSSTSNSLRKVRSASNNVLNRTKSNDSVNSGSKRKRGGLLGALFGSSNSGSTSTVTSPATSRRSSLSSNENVGVSSVRRKKRWGFLK